MTPLWLPGGPLVDSLEAYALDDLTPPPPLHPDPWATGPTPRGEHQ